MVRLILASSSPRRSQLLREAGIAFEVARPDIDETPYPGEAPDAYVLRLSREKALAIPAQQGMVVLSADTTVADGQHILGKPTHADEAAAMLRQLQGRTHTVHTGVSVLDGSTKHLSSQVTTSQVTMRAFSEADIAAYVASGDPLGKAGSYAIQNTDYRPVSRLEGCYTNVVGLPVCITCAILSEYGLDAPHAPGCSPSRLPCVLGKLD